MKYSDKKQWVKVEITEKKESFHLDFIDRGIGIPAEDLELIFTRFFRTEGARASKKTGSGLGLSIVDAIVEKHGGKILVSSVVMQGTTFTLILPKVYKKRIY